MTTRTYRYNPGLLLAVLALDFMNRQSLDILLQPIKADVHLSRAEIGALSLCAFGQVRLDGAHSAVCCV
jgi:hypothetical protein